MQLELFIDTQSLFYDVRFCFGEQRRLDFVHLPKTMADQCSLPDSFLWANKNAFVVQKGPTFRGFSDLLRSFGYNVILIDRNAQDIEIGMYVVRACTRLDGAAVISGNRRLAYLFKHLLTMQKACYVGTPQNFFDEEFDKEIMKDVTRHVFIDENWLWRGA